MRRLFLLAIFSFLVPAAGYCAEVPFRDKAVDQAMNAADPDYERANAVIVSSSRTPDDLRKDVAAAPAYHYDMDETKSQAAAVNLSPHLWSLGVESYYYRYREPGPDISLTGHFVGVVGGYNYRGWFPPSPAALDQWNLSVEGRYAWGEVDYDGWLFSGAPMKTNNINDYVLELRGTAGYDYPVGDSFVFTPFFGLAYRYLDDREQKRSDSGYERKSNYFYGPLGLNTKMNMGAGWSLGLTLEYDIFFSGRQVSYLGRDISPAISNAVRNTQDSGYGTRASFRLLYEGAIDVSVEPFVRFWHIQDSNGKFDPALGGYLGEPENRTVEAGVRLGLGF